MFGGELTPADVEDAVARAVAPLAVEVERLSGHVAVLTERLGDRLLTRAEAAAYLGVSARTLDRWTREGTVRRASERPPRYTAPDLDAAIRQRRGPVGPA